jgi:hypothetical protein
MKIFKAQYILEVELTNGVNAECLWVRKRLVLIYMCLVCITEYLLWCGITGKDQFWKVRMGKKQKICLGYVRCEMSMMHPNGDIQLEMYIWFLGPLDINLDIIKNR